VSAQVRLVAVVFVAPFPEAITRLDEYEAVVAAASGVDESSVVATVVFAVQVSAYGFAPAVTPLYDAAPQVMETVYAPYWVPPAVPWSAGVPCVKLNDGMVGLPIAVSDPMEYQLESPIEFVALERTVYATCEFSDETLHVLPVAPEMVQVPTETPPFNTSPM
jgi:hypothetical protein